jgi:hypothetical protein
VTEAQRIHARSAMDLMYAHRSQFDYPPGDQRTARDGYSWNLTEQRMEAFLKIGGRPMMDCSEYAPWCLKCANAWPWNVPGSTSAHLAWWLARGWRIYADPKEAGIAALVIFGGGGGHHEAIVHTPDLKRGNPLLSSHGESGLDLITLGDETARQTALGYPGVRFLSVVKL